MQETTGVRAPGRFYAIKHRVDTTLGWALAALMGVAVVNVVWQVASRYVVQSPSPYTDELARYVLIWLGLFGAAYGAGQRMHLAIDLLPQKLTGGPKHLLGMLIEAVVFSFALFVMVFGGLRLVALTLMLEQTSAALQVPLGYVYLALPLSGALIMFYATLFFLDHLRALRGKQIALRETEESSAEGFGTEAGQLGGTRIDEDRVR
jgi:TRAP-type C4-dicarboxylate transport system permease small subunit